MPEILKLKILVSIDAAAREKHIRHAVFKRVAVFYLDIEIIQFFKKTVLTGIHEVAEVVGHIVLNGIFRRRYERVCQCGFIVQFPERVFKALNNIGFITLFHLPYTRVAGKPALMGVGNVKVMLEPVIAVMFIVKDGNAGRALVDPAPKHLIPFLNLQYGGGVGALRVD